jgi:SulP family sulfate permease
MTSSSPSSSFLPAPIATELHPKHLLSSAIAGGVTGIIGIIRGISYAALIFSGTLTPYLNVGVGIAIFSTAAISIMVALFSSLPGMIATPLAAPTAVLAVMAAAIAAQMAEGDPQIMVLTVIAAIAIGSLCTGLFLFILGRLKLGQAVSFIPYPVVGGFMAGTGLLLVRGGVQVMSDLPVTLATLPQLMQPTLAWHWGVGVCLGVALLGVTKQIRHYLILPGSLVLMLLTFYGALWITQTPVDAAREAGWLLQSSSQGGLWHPLGWQELQQVDWGVILGQGGAIATLMFISLLSLVLTNNGIELAVEKDIDINQELQAVGLANFAAGLGGGMAGNQALPSTLLVHKMQANHRLAGVFKTIPCLLVLILGSDFLAYFPKPILGSLLLYLGIDLLIQWIYQAAFKLPLADYLTIVLIMVVINHVGFLQGVLVGLVMSVVLFVVNYSRIHATRDQFSGIHQQSTIARTPQEQDILDRQGEAIHILQLHGFIFFGRANHLLEAVRDRLEQDPPLRYLVLDFHLVSGIDSSATLNFTKIRKLATQQEIRLVYIGLTDDLVTVLQRGDALDSSTTCQQFTTLNQGLAWCESQLLGESAAHLNPPAALPNVVVSSRPASP